jgi:hypothetical protein
MADILSELYNACDPNRPATAEQYVDLSTVRGNKAFSNAVIRVLERTYDANNSRQTYLRALFAGHIGSGKSSELKHLQEVLYSGTGSTSRFLPVVMDGVEFLDFYNADVEDILVAIIVELAEQVRLFTDIDLKQTYLQKRWDEIRAFLVTDVETPEGEVGAGPFKAKLRLMRQSTEDRRRIREALRPRLPTFLVEINTAFADIRNRLRSAKPKDGKGRYTDFLLVADSLEKIMSVGQGVAEGPSHRRLFLEDGSHLAKLEAHAIWTAPLALVRSAPGELQAVFGRAPYVLPMVKIEKRGRRHESFEEGLRCLKEVIERRINPRMLDDAITPEASNWMTIHCGGDVRWLMTYIQAACNSVDNAPIPLSAARRAVNETAAVFAPAIGDSYLQKLVALERSADQRVDNTDPDIGDMLRQTWIMEYVNGSDDGDATPWYAVHPVVRNLPQFNRALDAAKSARIPAGGANG